MMAESTIGGPSGPQKSSPSSEVCAEEIPDSELSTLSGKVSA